MPKPKVNKALAYRKCQQCRKDRQKCTPEGRSWPGRRCDRCQRYDYACSANRTKNEETAPSSLLSFTRHDAESEDRALHYSPELRALPQGDADPEALCLQKLGDYHQILTTAQNLSFLRSFDHYGEELKIRELKNECTKDITVQAQTHQAQGRYKDAEYLYRQMDAASAPLKSSYYSLLKLQPGMVLIYEKLGNLPAAETLQQHRLLFLMRPELGSEDAIISREAENLFRLYTLFLARLVDLNAISKDGVLLTIFYRIAILSCSLLNTLLFKSEIWTLYNHELCLHIAIRVRSTEMIRGLISIGVDVNKGGDGWDLPLLSAARSGDLDGLELLLDNNVNVGAQNAYFRTALHEAMGQDPERRDEIIYCLIKAGVDVNAGDIRGQTALQSVVFAGPEPDEKIVRCLIEAGVNIEAEDWDKETVLYLAVRRGYLTTVQLLLQQRANTEVTGHTKETPLLCAVRTGQIKMVEILLDGGASVAARNALGQTPVDIASLNVRDGRMCGQMLLNTLLLHGN